LAWFKNQFSDFWVIFPALTVSFLLPWASIIGFTPFSAVHLCDISAFNFRI
jgi:hypothetical protein